MRDRSDRELERLFELDGGPGPARPVDGKRAAAIVAAAIGGAGFGPGGGGGGGSGGATGGGRAALGAKAKLVVLVGGGAAAIALATVAWVALRAPGPRPLGATGSAIAVVMPVVPGGGAAPAVVVVDAPAPIDEAVAPVEPPEIDMPAVADDRGRPTKRPRARGSAATPEDLLAEANAERGAHRWREADALYARVVAGAPKSLAAQTALVASASLHLEHLGDASGASRRFKAALAAGPHGALAEDARWGLAEAARATGDAGGERRALDDFLAHHASSPLATRARARRAEL